MLSNLKNLVSLTCQVIRKCEFQSSYQNGKLLSANICDLCGGNQRQNFHSGTPRMKYLKEMEIKKAVKHEVKNVGKVDIDYGVSVNLKRSVGTNAPNVWTLKAENSEFIFLKGNWPEKGIPQRSIILISHSIRKEGFFPTGDLTNTVINGMTFKDIPIIHVKATRNNTIISLSDQGKIKVLRSCGVEGFKNTRKGTNVAAQTTGFGFAVRAVRYGYKSARVVVNGLGPGRLSALKGLQLGGMNIMSITDATIDVTSLRPRKQRRV